MDFFKLRSIGPSQKPRLWVIVACTLLFVSFTTLVFPAGYELCARGEAATFTQTVQVSIFVEGPELEESDRKVLFPFLVNHYIWKGKAEKVFLEPLDYQLCSASLGRENDILLSLTEEEVQQLRNEIRRGVGDTLPIADVLSQRATVRSRIPSLVPGAQDDSPYYILRIYYATNRNVTNSLPSKEPFGSERSSQVSFGTVNVSIPKDHRMGELESPSILRLEFFQDPQKHITLHSLQSLDPKIWLNELHERASTLGNPGVLVFIHGYNVGFVEAAKRTAQLTYDLAFPGPTMFFSWPSQGGLIAYTVDEQAAQWSVPYMKRILSSLADLGPSIPIYVIAHSMGNRLLTHAFKNLLEEDLTKRRAFKEIILAAPDLDAVVFQEQIAPAILSRSGPRVTLYASQNDRALILSRKIHGGYQRLGETSPTPVVISKMDTVDASNVRTDFLGHSYFGDSGTVMADLFYLIRQRLKPDERFALKPVGPYWSFK